MSARALWSHVAIVLLAGGVSAVGHAMWAMPDLGVRSLILRYTRALDRDLGFLRFRARGWQVAAAQTIATCAVLTAASVTRNWAIAPLGLSMLVAPRLWLQRKRTGRVLELEGQLAEWLVSVSGALRAGNSLGEALAATIVVSRPPIAQEIELMMQECRLGMPLDTALERMGARNESRTLRSAIVVLTMARRTGGDVPATLERAASSLREMARLAGVIRTKTAEGRAQAFVISIIPAPLVAFIDWASADYFAPLRSSPVGYAVLAGAALLWVVAIVVATRIVAVEV